MECELWVCAVRRGLWGGGRVWNEMGESGGKRKVKREWWN